MISHAGSVVGTPGVDVDGVLTPIVGVYVGQGGSDGVAPPAVGWGDGAGAHAAASKSASRHAGILALDAAIRTGIVLLMPSPGLGTARTGHLTSSHWSGPNLTLLVLPLLLLRRLHHSSIWPAPGQ